MNRLFYVEITEAVVLRCSVKKVFLEISQNSEESTCTRVSFLIKLLAWPATLLKRIWHKCFPVNFAKFLRTPFFTELKYKTITIQVKIDAAFFGKKVKV